MRLFICDEQALHVSLSPFNIHYTECIEHLPLLTQHMYCLSISISTTLFLGYLKPRQLWILYMLMLSRCLCRHKNDIIDHQHPHTNSSWISYNRPVLMDTIQVNAYSVQHIAYAQHRVCMSATIFLVTKKTMWQLVRPNTIKTYTAEARQMVRLA